MTVDFGDDDPCDCADEGSADHAEERQERGAESFAMRVCALASHAAVRQVGGCAFVTIAPVGRIGDIGGLGPLQFCWWFMPRGRLIGRVGGGPRVQRHKARVSGPFIRPGCKRGSCYRLLCHLGSVRELT